MRNRAYRRHQTERTKNKVKHYFLMWGDENNKRVIGMLSKTKRPCSCYMCKKYSYEKRISERILKLEVKELCGS